MGSEAHIAAVDALPVESTFLFRVRDHDGGNVREAILVRLNGDVVGWLNYCQHLRHIRLDKGTGATMRGDELVCTNHGAMFEVDTGFCTFGPCEGAYLDPVEVAVRDGEVYLADDAYAFVGVGPIERDPLDRASRSNIEF